MKNVRYEWNRFDDYNLQTLEKYLEEMAAQGWKIQAIDEFFLRFCKAEPKKIHVWAVYVAHAATADYEPTQEQKQMIERYEQAGWYLLTEHVNLMIFGSEEEMPGQVSEEVPARVENLWGAVKKMLLAYNYIPCALFLFILYMFLSHDNMASGAFLASIPKILTLVISSICLIWMLFELCRIYHWHKHAVKKAQDQIFVKPPKSYHGYRWGSVCFILGLYGLFWGDEGAQISFLISFACVVFLVILYQIMNSIFQWYLLSERKRTWIRLPFQIVFILVINLFPYISDISDNMYFPWMHTIKSVYEKDGEKTVIFDDEIPLTMDLLFDVEEKDISGKCIDRSSSPLAGFSGYSARLTKNGWKDYKYLNYSITDIKVPALKESIISSEIQPRRQKIFSNLYLEYEYLPMDSEVWGAEKVYRCHMVDNGIPAVPLDELVVCYEDRMIHLNYDWYLSEEQIRIIAETLK